MHKNIFLLFIIFFSSFVCARTLDELRMQQEQLENELQKIKQKIDPLEWQEIHDLYYEIEALDYEIEALETEAAYQKNLEYLKLPLFRNILWACFTVLPESSLLTLPGLLYSVGWKHAKSEVKNLLFDNKLRTLFCVMFSLFLRFARLNRKINRDEIFYLIDNYFNAKTDKKRARAMQMIEALQDSAVFENLYRIELSQNNCCKSKELRDLKNIYFVPFYHCGRSYLGPLTYASYYAENKAQAFVDLLSILENMPYFDGGGYDSFFEFMYINDTEEVTNERKGAEFISHVKPDFLDSDYAGMGCSDSYTEDLLQNCSEDVNNAYQGYLDKYREYEEKVTGNLLQDEEALELYQCRRDFRYLRSEQRDIGKRVFRYRDGYDIQYGLKKTLYNWQNFIEERVNVPAVVFIATKALCAGLLLK